MVSQSWRFEWIVGTDDVLGASFFALWDNLFQRAKEASIFQHPGLGRAWLESCGSAQGLKPEFCLATSGAGDQVLVPLVRRPRVSHNLWLRRLEGLGEPNFDYQDPTVVECAAGGTQNLLGFWAAFGQELGRRRIDSCWLRRLRPPSAPPGATPDTGLTSPIIPLGGCADWDDFARRVPSKLRTDVARQRRRLAEQGRVDLRVLDSDEVEEGHRQLDAMMASHEARWRGSESAALFMRPGLRDFYHQALARLLPSGVLHFSCLRLDDRAIAWHFGFFWNGALHWYKPVYDPVYSNSSPGKILLALLIDRGIRERWTHLDLGVGEEAYKRGWASESVPLFQNEWRVSGPRDLLRTVRMRLKGIRP
jgi:CelD/BcsL family acetyltransferase involved in cellulose biosynthesis